MPTLKSQHFRDPARGPTYVYCVRVCVCVSIFERWWGDAATSYMGVSARTCLGLGITNTPTCPRTASTLDPSGEMLDVLRRQGVLWHELLDGRMPQCFCGSWPGDA